MTASGDPPTYGTISGASWVNNDLTGFKASDGSTSVSWPADSGTYNPVNWVQPSGPTLQWGGPIVEIATLKYDPVKFSKELAGVGETLATAMAEELDKLFINGTNKKEKKMPKNDERTVFNVFVIDPDGDGKVVATLNNVIAQGAEAAKLKAIYELSTQSDRLEKDLEDYDLLVEDVADYGSIRPK